MARERRAESWIVKDGMGAAGTIVEDGMGEAATIVKEFAISNNRSQ